MACRKLLTGIMDAGLENVHEIFRGGSRGFMKFIQAL